MKETNLVSVTWLLLEAFLLALGTSVASLVAQFCGAVRWWGSAGPAPSQHPSQAACPGPCPETGVGRGPVCWVQSQRRPSGSSPLSGTAVSLVPAGSGHGWVGREPQVEVFGF